MGVGLRSKGFACTGRGMGEGSKASRLMQRCREGFAQSEAACIGEDEVQTLRAGRKDA